MIRALLTIGAIYAAGVTTLIVAGCICQARDNAKIRAARRKSSAEALELALMRREFADIVAHFSTTDQENR